MKVLDYINLLRLNLFITVKAAGDCLVLHKQNGRPSNLKIEEAEV